MLRLIQIVGPQKGFAVTPKVVAELPRYQQLSRETGTEPLYSADKLAIRWMVSESSGHDLGCNISNWQRIVDEIDPKTKADADNTIIVGRPLASILESRREFISQLASQKGIGPVRLRLITDLLKIHVPTFVSNGDPRDFVYYNKVQGLGFVRWAVI